LQYLTPSGQVTATGTLYANRMITTTVSRAPARPVSDVSFATSASSGEGIGDSCDQLADENVEVAPDDADEASLTEDVEHTVMEIDEDANIRVTFTPAGEDSIAWDKKSKKRVASEKNRKVSAKAKVHDWLPGLQ
jgi:hypothetical protein